MALGKKNIPILVGGGIDTKTNPKLVRGPALLELENAYQQRTGELSPRNGMLAFDAGGNSPGAPMSAAFALPGGPIARIGRWSNQGQPSVMGVQGSAAAGGIGNPYFFLQPHPNTTVRLDQFYSSAAFSDPSPTASDLVDPDICTFGSKIAVCWTENGGSGKVELITGSYQDIITGTAFPHIGGVIPGDGFPGRLVGGSTEGTLFLLDNSAPPTLKALNLNTTVVTTVATGVSPTEPWFDARLKTATNRAIVTFRDNAGGFKILEWDMNTNAITLGPTTFASAGVMSGLSLLADRFGASQHVVTYSDNAIGVRAIAFNATTMANSANYNIAPAATANVKNLTGFLVDAAAVQFRIYWQLDNATKHNRRIDIGWQNGGSFTGTWHRSVGITGKAFYVAALGSWCIPASYESPTQSVGLLLYDASQGANGGASQYTSSVMAQYANGTHGGGTVAPHCPASTVPALTGTEFWSPIVIRTRVANATGTSFTYRRAIRLGAYKFDAHLYLSGQIDANTTLIPGGMVTSYDGHSTSHAAQIVQPETPAVAGGAGGSMTPSKTYSYKQCWAWRTASGSLWRSGTCPPISITLGGAQTSTSVTAVTNRIAGELTGGNPVPGAPYIELYRAGPLEDGATGYNLVAINRNNASADTVVIVDTMSNANALLQEPLYTTGNVQENLCPPSCALMTVNNNRVWVASTENTDEVWYSKEVTGGQVGFNNVQTIKLGATKTGTVTALGAMDGRTIAFKLDSIFSIAGDGPNALGQGGFSQPAAISRTLGAKNGVLAETPDGLMFQSNLGGIYLLDRGNGTSYIGAPVEKYTLLEDVVGACAAPGTTQVRFVMASGRCLVWDWFFKSWVTFLLPVFSSTIFDCTVVNGAWCYVLANGFVYAESTSATADQGNLTITPRISFPHLDFAGVGGYQRLYSLAFTLDAIGNHTISVDAEYDYSGAVTGAPKTKALAAGMGLVVEYLPPEGKNKGTAVRPVITISGAALSGSFRLTGLMAVVGVKRGDRAVETNRLT